MFRGLDDAICLVGIPVHGRQKRHRSEQEVENRISKEVLRTNLRRQPVLGGDGKGGADHAKNEETAREEHTRQKSLPVDKDHEEDREGHKRDEHDD